MFQSVGGENMPEVMEANLFAPRMSQDFAQPVTGGGWSQRGVLPQATTSHTMTDFKAHRGKRRYWGSGYLGQTKGGRIFAHRQRKTGPPGVSRWAAVLNQPCSLKGKPPQKSTGALVERRLP